MPLFKAACCHSEGSGFSVLLDFSGSRTVSFCKISYSLFDSTVDLLLLLLKNALAE